MQRESAIALPKHSHRHLLITDKLPLLVADQEGLSGGEGGVKCICELYAYAQAPLTPSTHSICLTTINKVRKKCLGFSGCNRTHQRKDNVQLHK